MVVRRALTVANVPAPQSRVLRWWSLLWVVALFAPPIPLSFTPTSYSKVSLAVLVCAVYLAWRSLILGRGIPLLGSSLKYFLPALVIYFIAHAVGFGLNKGISILLMEGQWIIYFLAAFLLVWDMRFLPNLETIVIRRLLLFMSLEAAIAIITSFTGPIYSYVVGAYAPRLSIDIYRAVGTLEGANGLAGLLAFAAVLAAWSPKQYLPFRRMWLLSLLVVALLLTQSKSGISAFSIANIAAVLLMHLKALVIYKMKIPYKILLTTVLISLVTATALFLYGPTIARVISEDYTERVQLTSRVWDQYWAGSLDELLFGFGFRQTAQITEDGTAWITSHNSYVSFWAELGIIGFLLLLGALITVLIAFVGKNRWYWVGGLVALLVHFSTEVFLYGYLYVMAIALLFALGDRFITKHHASLEA